MDCEKNKCLLPTASKPLIYLRFLKFYNYTRTKKPFMPYPGVDGFLGSIKNVCSIINVGVWFDQTPTFIIEPLYNLMKIITRLYQKAVCISFYRFLFSFLSWRLRLFWGRFTWNAQYHGQAVASIPWRISFWTAFLMIVLKIWFSFMITSEKILLLHTKSQLSNY